MDNSYKNSIKLLKKQKEKEFITSYEQSRAYLMDWLLDNKFTVHAHIDDDGEGTLLVYYEDEQKSIDVEILGDVATIYAEFDNEKSCGEFSAQIETEVEVPILVDFLEKLLAMSIVRKQITIEVSYLDNVPDKINYEYNIKSFHDLVDDISSALSEYQARIVCLPSGVA